MRLTTMTAAKGHINVGGTVLADSNDTFIKSLVKMWSARAEKYLNRVTVSGATTQDFDVEPRQQVFTLSRYPVTTVSAVYNDGTRAWSSVTAISSAYYHTDTQNGLLRMDGYPLDWGPATLRVVYTGGMAPSTASFIVDFPEIATAVDMQVAYHYARKGSLGAAGIETPGGGVSWDGALTWLKASKGLLDEHRRWTLGG